VTAGIMKRDRDVLPVRSERLSGAPRVVRVVLKFDGGWRFEWVKRTPQK